MVVPLAEDVVAVVVVLVVEVFMEAFVVSVEAGAAVVVATAEVVGVTPPRDREPGFILIYTK